MPAEQSKTETAPAKSDKHPLEQTLDVIRFIEEKGYSKQKVAYFLYCSTEYPRLDPEKLF